MAINARTKNLLRPAFNLLSTRAEGREVLDAIKKLKVHIEFGDPPGKADGAYDPLINKIILRRNRSDLETALTLSHEVRHAWQFKILEWNHGMTSFEHLRTRINITRMIEGDAFACAGVLAEALLDESPAKPSTYLKYFMDAQNWLATSYDKEIFSNDKNYIASRAGFAKMMKVPAVNALLENYFIKEMFSPKVKMEKLRKLCVAGFNPSAKNYLEAVSAKDLYHATRLNKDGSTSIQKINRLSQKSASSYRKIYDAMKLGMLQP